MSSFVYHILSPTSRRVKSIPRAVLCATASQLDEHSKAQIFEPLQAVLFSNCSLKGRDLVVFNNKFCPSLKLWPEYRKANLLNVIRQITSIWFRCSHPAIPIHGISCSLASHPSWENNIFHWFLDLLPRVLAAEIVAHSPANVKLLKPGNLLDWQQESLEILGYNTTSLISLPDTSSLSVTADSFVSLLNSRSSQAGGLSFRTHPYIVRTLRQRFSSVKTHECCTTAERIFIVRNSLSGRNFLNMDDINDFAIANRFLLIELSSLSLSAQVQLFQNATHVIGAHGAGLTHIIHCTNAAIMEVHCSSHGIRSDYFQIAAINNLRYFYHVCNPANFSNDMLLDIQVLRSFILLSSD
jgi:hypothetical protein